MVATEVVIEFPTESIYVVSVKNFAHSNTVVLIWSQSSDNIFVGRV
jgi:hypothetical protein